MLTVVVEGELADFAKVAVVGAFNAAEQLEVLAYLVAEDQRGAGNGGFSLLDIEIAPFSGKQIPTLVQTICIARSKALKSTRRAAAYLNKRMNRSGEAVRFRIAGHLSPLGDP